MKRILVIDDDGEIRDMLAIMLEQEGYEAVRAENGAAGLRLYREKPFDLVITDIFMPEMEGLETIRELRQLDPGARIIAISGGSSRAAMDFLPLAEHLGASCTLHKPIPGQELLDAVARVLQDVSK
jgi:CheY-like chemotaxis protein